MPVNDIKLVGERAQAAESVLLTGSNGSQTLLISISRADVVDFAQQPLLPSDQNFLIEKNLKTLAPLISEKHDRGEVTQPTDRRTGRVTTLIELTRDDLRQGLRRYEVTTDANIGAESLTSISNPTLFTLDAPGSGLDQGYLSGPPDRTSGFAPDLSEFDQPPSDEPTTPFAFDTPGAGWDEGTWSELPDLPTQGSGPHFEIAKGGVIDFVPPEALDREGNNVERLRRLHPPLRDLACQLGDALTAGNAPHAQLGARIHEYRKRVDQDLEAIDFTLLYVEGVRLANAERAALEKIAEDELPPLGEENREKLDTLLQLHGTFMLGTVVGADLIAAEQRYQRQPAEEREYRAAAVDFATSLQNQPGVVAPIAAAFVLGAAEQIGQGTNFERSAIVATTTLNNFAIVLAAAAAVTALPVIGGLIAGTGGIIAGGLGGLLASESLKKSKPFATVIAPIIAAIDRAPEIDLQKYKSFLLSISEKARRLARKHKQFQWLDKALDWVTASNYVFNPNLFHEVGELALSDTTQNVLQNDNIIYIGDLVQKTEAEMMLTPNCTRRVLNEILERLASIGLHLGMELTDWPPENFERFIAQAKIKPLE